MSLDLQADLLQAAAPLAAERGAPLAPHTSLRVGGPADLLATAGSLAELERWLRLARERNLPVTLLGKGSNSLVADAGVAGLVILNRAAEERLEGQRLTVASGAALPALAGRTARWGLAGLEWATGVPGTVGGAVISNAGIHGFDIQQSLRWVRVVDGQGAVQRYAADELGLAYRTSRFRQGERAFILEAGLELSPEDPAVLLARVREHNAYRRRTQPSEHSVGSIFKNPPGDYAGRLIEATGLKGRRVGGAQVSPVHANFIVNTGTASARDCWDLSELVREEVQRRFGVRLEWEIEPVGRWDERGQG